MFKKLSILLLFSFACYVFAGDFSVRGLKLDHPDGFYRKGEEIVLKGKLLKAGKPAPDHKLRVNTIWESKKVVATQDFPCDGTPFEVRFKSDKPGWVYFTLQVIGPDGQVVKKPGRTVVQRRKKELVAEIGAMISPEEIRPADAIPADFDEFWAGEIAKLNAVPMNPRLEKIESGRQGIELYTVKLDAGVSQPATGYLAVPVGAKAKSLPVYLTFLSGVNGDAPRNSALKVAGKGAVAMVATWHGFDVNREQAYYDRNCKKIQAWKTATDREAFYFREVFIRALRAAQYLKSRPEWNGRDFLVGGGSLAGAQTVAVAALDPQVTLAFIHTPSHSGYNADLAGRKRALPFHWQSDKVMTPTVRQSVPYCDVTHLASRIRCESYFCTAFADEVCTPSNVYAAYNNLPAGVKKVMTTNPHTGHYGTTDDFRARQRMDEFFKNLRKR